MIVSLLQRDIIWADPAANRQRADEALRALPPSDLIVLPEMFSTGFATQPVGIAESADSPTLAWMRRVARERDCAVAGSVAVGVDDRQWASATPAEGGGQAGLGAALRYVNRFYFVTPDGREVHYDKRHLFTYGGEHLRYTPGDRRIIAQWRGVRIRLLVCYDLRFPAWCRNLAADDVADDATLATADGAYDLALVVASWPSSRVEAWDALLRARAIENQCYVAGVNRVGTDPLCQYPGSSALIDPYGRVAASCGRDRECATTAELDLDRLRAFRRKFPVLADADAFRLL